MRQSLYAGVAAAALVAGGASAEQITIFGPWIGADQEHVEAVLSVFAERTATMCATPARTASSSRS
jgi:alpha-glucoside transport system substrate-binding protein